jgi:hypothetical protein
LFSVQQSLNQSLWSKVAIIHVSDVNQTKYFWNTTQAEDEFTTFSFRIVANREEYDKPVDGIPSPASEPKTVIELCQGMAKILMD